MSRPQGALHEGLGKGEVGCMIWRRVGCMAAATEGGGREA